MGAKKKSVVVKRTKFISMKQESDESIIKYLHCLRNACRYCGFEKLRQEEQVIEEDLFDGIYNASHWNNYKEEICL